MGYQYFPYREDQKGYLHGWCKSSLNRKFGPIILKQFPNIYLCRNNNDLKYHSSWEWLMPVIQKIERIHDDYHGYFNVHISSNACVIQGTRLITTPENFHPAYFADHIGETKLEAAYRAVVEFINWYDGYRNQVDSAGA